MKKWFRRKPKTQRLTDPKIGEVYLIHGKYWRLRYMSTSSGGVMDVGSQLSLEFDEILFTEQMGMGLASKQSRV